MGRAPHAFASACAGTRVRCRSGSGRPLRPVFVAVQRDVARASVGFTDDPPACPSAPRVDVAGALPPVFDRLDSAQQRRMLSYRWGHVAGPSMLPVLRQLVFAPAVEPEMRAAALVRLGELAPDEATRVSREDVIAGRFSFSTQALRLASADTPVLTQALARQLADARAQSTSLSDLQDGQGAMRGGCCRRSCDWRRHARAQRSPRGRSASRSPAQRVRASWPVPSPWTAPVAYADAGAPER